MDEKEKILLAKQIIENPLYNKIIEDIRNYILGKWKNTLSPNSEEREGLWLMNKMLDKLNGMIQSYAKTPIIVETEKQEEVDMDVDFPE